MVHLAPHLPCLKTASVVLLFPSDASDEQNSQSSMENSMNSSEQVERQPSGDVGLAAETSTISQVPRSRSQRGSQIGQEPAGVSGVRQKAFCCSVSLFALWTIGTVWYSLSRMCEHPSVSELVTGAHGEGGDTRVWPLGCVLYPSPSLTTLFIRVHKSTARSQ